MDKSSSDSSASDALYRIRHSLAHVMAQAVLQIRPKALLAFGPPIDNGFYYDFLFEQPITSEDFADIEKRMRKIIAERQEFKEEKLPVAAALSKLRERGERFKVEYAEELIGKGESELGFYVNGPFEDMCRGPHVEHTGKIPPDCFKIDSVAGAYWRGSEKNPQLSRLYALAFANKKELEEYLKRRELARERDHRKLGKELELFTIEDKVGQGLPLWLPHGTAIKEELENYAKEVEFRYGYQRVSTPHIAKEDLYLTSGHLPYYKDTMFPPMKLEGESDYYLKAMNCPHHHLIYASRPRSYRELPLRLAEFGTVYRFEASGTLAGLLRVRSLCQNDAHIYCTLPQIKEIARELLEMHLEYYKLFRFEGVTPRLSLHDPNNKEKYIENPDAWRFSEGYLKEIIEEARLPYYVGEGEAAFYGPKIDFQAKTLLGREESIGTVQLDFQGAINFDLNYTGEDGKNHRPYIFHRAPLSTHERFLAFLIEHFGGAFPTWMAPIQARVIPVAPDVMDYAREIQQALHNALIRVDVDGSDNSFNKKIREGATQKIPNLLIVGAREKEQRQVTLRRYCVKEQVALSFDAFIQRMLTLKQKRLMDNFPDVIVP
jgi:threonyl-tRNA synthetase